MFTDEAPSSVTLPSLWRKSRQSAQETRSTQTRALHESDTGVQTVWSSSSSTQTEPKKQDSQPPPTQMEPPGLLEFLQRVEARMVNQLKRNSESHAFHGYQPYWEDHNQQVSRLHYLLHPSAQDKGLHVSCVSWSCTGSVVLCGYGRIDEGDWSTEGSYVCGWNVDRGGLQSRQPHLIIDVPTAVTALSCHPSRPAIIAGGLYSGEVVVWDSSRTQDPVLAQTGLSVQSHREPVYQVMWVPLQKKGEFGVVSGCSGGRVLLWSLDTDQGLLVLSAAYELLRQQIPNRSSSKACGNSRVGVTSLAVSPWDMDTFLVGSEDGLLLRCSFSSQTLAEASSSSSSSSTQNPRERLRAPATFSFTPHSGPVHSIHCSPFHRNLFAAGGTQGVVALYSLLQADPLLVLRVSDCYVFMVQFSPSRPLLLAAATGHGEVHIFDLGRRSLRPAFILEQWGAKAAPAAATCLAFNSSIMGLLAVGSSDGSVSVWQLSSEQMDQNPKERSQLELIANQVAE